MEYNRVVYGIRISGFAGTVKPEQQTSMKSSARIGYGMGVCGTGIGGKENEGTVGAC